MYLEFTGSDEAQAKLSAELAAARLEFGPIEKDREGQYGLLKFKYATLGMLVAATATALAKHGITVLQPLTDSPDNPTKHRVTTIVRGHGASISAAMDFNPKDAREESHKGAFEGIKEYGKLTAYLRRYGYQSMLVLDAEPDLDEAGVPAGKPEAVRREAPRPPAAQAPRQAPAPASAPVQAARPPAPAQRQQTLAPAAIVPPSVVNDDAPAPTTPVTPVTPAPVEVVAPRIVIDEDDGPVDADMGVQIKALRDQLGLSKLGFSQLCQREAGVPVPHLHETRKGAYKVMVALQKLILERQATAGAPLGAA